MKRREFTLGAAAAALPGLLSQPAHAQSGKGYTELGRRAPVEAPPGQVEVVEFFSYGCVHCKNFEPMFGAWKKAAPNQRSNGTPTIGNIAKRARGTVSTTAMPNRRLMSRNSESSSWALFWIDFGSSAIPHFGQLPG